MKNLPIGIQSFEDLRSNNYLYVDKTEFIHRLVTTGKTYFLSRPRRFGKSMLISTIDALFKGKKELFEGLYIYDKWDWLQTNPIIRMDWSAVKHDTPEEMEADLSVIFQAIANRYDITLNRPFVSGRFAELIEALHQKTGRKVVILIDEYDVPILDAMNKPELKAIQESLQSIYRILKAADEHIRLIFLTGVSKFAKLSIFSALNSPNDITIDKKYTMICGYTQAELEAYFSEYIDAMVMKTGNTREDLLDKIRLWYDGYTWDGENRVYNPFSTLLFFDKKIFSNYWFSSGTPAFLIEQLQMREQVDLALEPIEASSKIFDSFDPNHIDNISLMFQTGYLTIKKITPTDASPLYTLAVPNREVKQSLLEYLVSLFSFYPLAQVEPLVYAMHRQLKNCDAEGFAQSIRTMLANIPYNIQIGNEKYYHSLFLSWMTMLGFKAHGEVLTGSGRMDAVLELPEVVVIAELKYHAKTKTGTLLRNAMKQIDDRKYYEKYSGQGKTIILMGLAFSGKEVGCKFSNL